MPPKHKKIGRPPGSKNKKPSKNSKITSVLREIKSEVNLIKTENVRNDNGTHSFDSEVSDQDQDSSNVSIRNIDRKKVIYNCKKCPNKNFKFMESYKAHLLLEHSTSPGAIGCLQCHVVCPDKDTLEAHISRVHDRNIYRCRYCHKEFVRQAHVLRHMAQKGCDGGKVASFPCEICFANFTRKDNLIVHLRQMHIQKPFFRCKHENCGFSSKNFTKLIRHWHGTHVEVPNQFECDFCGKSTMSRAAMAKHLEIHGEKKFSCDVCGYSTYTIEVMRRHILTHVDEKPYKCKVCGLSYIQRAQLERHSEKHVGNNCSICGEEFNCKAKLIIHQRKHGGVHDLSCPYNDCKYSTREFKNESNLISHLCVHLEAKSWSCEVCRKKFRSEMNMRRHLATHTLDRPRRCMYCVSARAYVRGQQLVRHVRKFHADIFRTHLVHVRNVLSSNPKSERVTRSELESILNVLDAESERILEGYSGAGVLYGGMQPDTDTQHSEREDENAPLMSEEDLAENLRRLLAQLIDEDTLQCLGWPDESVDNILEKVIEQCGARPADRGMWSRVQRLRENAKHLFLYVVDDKTIALMLGTHTIDQIVKHMLAQVAAADTDSDSGARRPSADTIEIEIEMT